MSTNEFIIRFGRGLAIGGFGVSLFYNDIIAGTINLCAVAIFCLCLKE